METIELRAILEKFPKQDLGIFPTPFHKLANLSEEYGIDLYIKRDDMTGRNLFGGNKVRKLDYLIKDAVDKGSDYVFTFGATQSNHAMQTTWTANVAGLKPVLYLTALVKPDPDDYKANLLLDKIMGAEIHIVYPEEGESFKEAMERSYKLADEHIKELEKDGHKATIIPMGGANETGTLGYVEGYLELIEDLDDNDIKADYIYHSTGSGGTMAGITIANKLLDRDIEVVSVSAGLAEDDYLDKTAALCNSTLEMMGLDEKISPADFNLRTEYAHPGYEIPSTEANKDIRLLAAKEGILTDTVYSGKAFYGMMDDIRTGRIPKGSTVVFIHTGGALALFSEREILGDL